MSNTCKHIAIKDEDHAKHCDNTPGCVADRLNEVCLQIPDCSRFTHSHACEQQPGCFYDGSNCQQNGLAHKQNFPLPRFVNDGKNVAPAPAPKKEHKHHNRTMDHRMTHVCVPHDAQVPTMLASKESECRFPCEQFSTHDECMRQPAPSRMCEWKHNKCNVLPNKYEIVSQITNPARFADLLQQRSGALVHNPNMAPPHA